MPVDVWRGVRGWCPCALDLDKAFRLYRDAADGNYVPAMGLLGSCYLSAKGTSWQPSLGLKWLRAGAAGGDLSSRHFIARLTQLAKDQHFPSLDEFVQNQRLDMPVVEPPGGVRYGQCFPPTQT